MPSVARTSSYQSAATTAALSPYCFTSSGTYFSRASRVRAASPRFSDDQNASRSRSSSARTPSCASRSRSVSARDGIGNDPAGDQRVRARARIGPLPLTERAGDLLRVQAQEFEADFGLSEPRNRADRLRPRVSLGRPGQEARVTPVGVDRAPLVRDRLEVVLHRQRDRRHVPQRRRPLIGSALGLGDQLVLRRVVGPVSYTHLRAHETDSYLVCRLLLEK